MKKIRIIITLFSLIALLLSGCGGVKFDITSSSKNAKIKINDVDDGEFAEIGDMSVSGGKKAQIESSLNSGKLKIEFCEAVLVSSADEKDEFIAGAILKTVEVGPGENIDVDLDPARYYVQVTAIGKTGGTVEIKIS